MKKIMLKIVALSGLLSALNANAETIITNEFWICNSTNTANLGTLDNPYDGSTQAKFDMVMSNMPANSTIHILAGTYETWGSYNWYPKSGGKIIGSGIDNTVLQFPSGTPQYGAGNSIISSTFDLTNIEVSDLTCDCNWSGGGYTYSGVVLFGSDNAVRRVRVIHCGYTSQINSEAWGVSLNGDGTHWSEGNIIEECEVSEFAGGHNITAFNFGGCSGIMRGNRAFLSPDPIGAQIAYNASGNADCLFEGNYVDGADDGFVSDTGSTTNTIFAHNIFKNVFNGFGFGNTTRANLTFNFNKILLTPSQSFAAFGFRDGTYHTNIVIFGNQVGYDGIPSGPPAYFIYATNVVGLTVGDNTVDASLNNYISASPINMFNNYDLYGNYLSALNIPSVGGVQVSSLGLNLISSANTSSALTNLGLPANPTEVITNTQTSVTLTGTFSGNGNGLTGLNWIDITGAPAFAQYSDSAPTFTNGMNIGANNAYQIGGSDVLWCSNSVGIGSDLVIGYESPGVVPNGLGNMIVGSYAMPSSTNANYSTMVGISAGRHMLSSQYNTLVGANAGFGLQYGNDNTFVGFQSGYGDITNGYQNTLIGDSTLYRASSGTNNVALGYMAGSWLYSGNNNVFIAHQGTSSETNSNGTIYIGDPGVHNTTYIAGTIVGNSLIATNGFQCATNYVSSTWTPIPGSVILRASNNWMFAITAHGTNAVFKFSP